MGSFVESATLELIDKASKPANKVNKALKELFKTADKMRDMKIRLDIEDKKLLSARKTAEALSRDLKKLSQPVRLNINSSSLDAAIRKARLLRSLTRGINGKVNTSGNGAGAPPGGGRGAGAGAGGTSFLPVVPPSSTRQLVALQRQQVRSGRKALSLAKSGQHGQILLGNQARQLLIEQRKQIVGHREVSTVLDEQVRAVRDFTRSGGGGRGGVGGGSGFGGMRGFGPNGPGGGGRGAGGTGAGRGGFGVLGNTAIATVGFMAGQLIAQKFVEGVKSQDMTNLLLGGAATPAQRRAIEAQKTLQGGKSLFTSDQFKALQTNILPDVGGDTTAAKIVADRLEKTQRQLFASGQFENIDQVNTSMFGIQKAVNDFAGDLVKNGQLTARAEEGFQSLEDAIRTNPNVTGEFAKTFIANLKSEGSTINGRSLALLLSMGGDTGIRVANEANSLAKAMQGLQKKGANDFLASAGLAPTPELKSAFLNDPIAAMNDIFIPKMDAFIKAQGKAVSPETRADFINQGLGRETSRNIAADMSFSADQLKGASAQMEATRRTSQQVDAALANSSLSQLAIAGARVTDAFSALAAQLGPLTQQAAGIASFFAGGTADILNALPEGSVSTVLKPLINPLGVLADTWKALGVVGPAGAEEMPTKQIINMVNTQQDILKAELAQLTARRDAAIRTPGGENLDLLNLRINDVNERLSAFGSTIASVGGIVATGAGKGPVASSGILRENAKAARSAIWRPSAEETARWKRVTGGKLVRPKDAGDVAEIKRIQREGVKKIDGIIGPETLALLDKIQKDATRNRALTRQQDRLTAGGLLPLPKAPGFVPDAGKRPDSLVSTFLGNNPAMLTDAMHTGAVDAGSTIEQAFGLGSSTISTAITTGAGAISTAAAGVSTGIASAFSAGGSSAAAMIRAALAAGVRVNVNNPGGGSMPANTGAHVGGPL